MFSALPYRLFERSFVVIFWFCLFGAPMALGYRLLALHGDMQLDQAADDNKNNETRMVAKLRWLVEWLPARLLGITLGLVGHFSQTFGQLRQMIFCSKTSASDLLHRCVAPSTGGLVGSPLSNTEIVSAIHDSLASDHCYFSGYRLTVLPRTDWSPFHGATLSNSSIPGIASAVQR